MGNDLFRTELRRHPSGVRVRSRGLSPLDTALWFALGVPALRGLSSRNPVGPSHDTPPRPVASDLLPLVRNEPDARFDNLKQWIVNAEIRAADDMGPLGHRQHAMLREFFAVVAELTPGMSFCYEGVDRQTFAVKLSSPDGPITLDLLSRGITAVLAWIGVLLQRLYEVYGNALDPISQPVLLLIDELDVHLHPDWQRSILPLVRRRFPQLRLVGTTHSPLIVASAGDAGIVQLSREDDGRLRAVPIEGSFAGLSPNEVLTSTAFGMETPLDLESDEALREYTTLLAAGRNPRNDGRAAELATLLREPVMDRTPYEQRGAELFREWLLARLSDAPEDQRTRLLGEAERYLDRLRARR